MARLIALTPCAGLLPVSEGGVTVSEVETGTLTSVAPFAGQKTAVSAALKAQVGAALPGVNRSAGPIMWFGHGVWMVAASVDLDGQAAVTDQTDAWAVVRIEGEAVDDILARLVPVDLRQSVFKTGHVAKTMLGHMSVTMTRVGPMAFQIMVMRSMAATLVHDLQVAARGVVAR